MANGIITLLTDFGTEDSFVGTMKGVILGIHPEATVVDLVHGIPPQDLRAGAFALMTAWKYFPKGTVHCCVVDPGVGTDRPILCVPCEGHLFLAPDNGLLRWAVRRPSGAIRIETRKWCREEVSSTFHGRDIFAPVAAELARGLDPSELGPPAEKLEDLPFPEPASTDKGLTGEVLYIDRFGNCITNLARGALSDRFNGTPTEKLRVEAGGRSWTGIVRTYREATPGRPAALIGSSGYLELAVPQGDARASLSLRPGSPVHLATP